MTKSLCSCIVNMNSPLKHVPSLPKISKHSITSGVYEHPPIILVLTVSLVPVYNVAMPPCLTVFTFYVKHDRPGWSVLVVVLHQVRVHAGLDPCPDLHVEEVRLKSILHA